ncbi:FAD-linked oxidoreductase [Aspergillus unguis]
MKTAQSSVRALSKPSYRLVSSTSNARSSLTAESNGLWAQTSPSPKKPSSSPLAKLPLSSVIRSLLILSASSSSVLLKPCIYTLSALAHPKTAVLDVAKNPLLNLVIKHTIYKQFNAGENKLEVQHSINAIKDLGYRGVLLGYAREVLVGESSADPHDEKASRKEIQMWLDGTLQTVDMAQEGDFVALKFTGMGVQALEYLQKQAAPSPFMDKAIQQICDLAISRNVRLLVDAEEQAVQPGIEEWAMKYQRYCNSRIPGRAVFYNTYQAYLCSTPTTLAKHLEISRKEGYTLGVKLVRGAYLKTEPRHLIWSKKEETDECYDGVVEALLTRRFNSMLKSANPEHATDLPPVNVIIATHNRESVRKAHALRLQQANRGENKNVDLSYAQLQGMADEISCELLEGFQAAETEKAVQAESPNVYKLLTWGSVKECMGFLLRRAVENTEAVGRTKQSQEAITHFKCTTSRIQLQPLHTFKLLFLFKMYLLPEPAVARILRSLTKEQCLSFLQTLDESLITVSSQHHSNPSENLIHQPLRTTITTKESNLSLFMPVSNTASTGIKVVTASKSHGIIGVINIFSPVGELLGLLSAAEITAFRTALAVMSLFVRLPTTVKKENVLVFGSGRQAEWHARLALLLCPEEINRIVFVNRGRARLNDLEKGVIADLKKIYPALIIETLCKEGIEDGAYDQRLRQELSLSNVVFSCTPSTEPNFPFPYLQPFKTRFISLIGSYRPHMQEIDTETLLSGGGKVYVDSREACLEESGELINAGMKGDQLIELGELYQTLGQGRIEVPEGSNVVMKCVGMGIMDLATGKRLLDLGREKGVGMEVDGF